ncbi:RICIN domain-containing protein [Streptomyces capparidis]
MADGGEVRNELTGSEASGAVVQAGAVHGGVHIHHHGPAPTGPGPRGAARRGTLVAATAAVCAVAGIAVTTWQLIDAGTGAPPAAAGTVPASAPRTAPPSASAADRSSPPTAPGPAPVSRSPEPSPLTPGPAPPSGAESPSAGGAARERAAPELPDGAVRYVNAGGGECLGVPDAGVRSAEPLALSACDDVAGILWEHHREETADGGTWYSVRSGHSGQCLSVDAARRHNGAPATQYPCGPYPDQYWSFRWDRRHHGWQLRNRNSGRCLAVQDGGTAGGTPVVQWECGDFADQFWRL